MKWKIYGEYILPKSNLLRKNTFARGLLSTNEDNYKGEKNNTLNMRLLINGYTHSAKMLEFALYILG